MQDHAASQAAHNTNKAFATDKREKKTKKNPWRGHHYALTLTQLRTCEGPWIGRSTRLASIIPSNSSIILSPLFSFQVTNRRKAEGFLYTTGKSDTWHITSTRMWFNWLPCALLIKPVKMSVDLRSSLPPYSEGKGSFDIIFSQTCDSTLAQTTAVVLYVHSVCRQATIVGKC